MIAEDVIGVEDVDYTITVDQKGFQKATSALTLTVGQTAQFNIPLSLGSETETITVNPENADTLDSETSNLDYTVQSKQANDLPLNGRNPYGLAVLAPGIVPGANFGVDVRGSPRSRRGRSNQQLPVQRRQQ